MNQNQDVEASGVHVYRANGDAVRCEVQVPVSTGGTAECRRPMDDEVHTGYPEGFADEDEDDLPYCSTADYIHAEHVAQIRVANAGQGVDRVAERVRNGILPKQSLVAANRELEAARHVLGLVHATQVGFDPADDVMRAVFGEWPLTSETVDA